MELHKMRLAALCWVLLGVAPWVDESVKADDPPTSSPPTIAEARARAKLLQETFHATLHVVHLRYYREDEGLIIPAKTLESVFGELERSQQVKVRWLAVNAPAMNVDHEANDSFEKAAVLALTKGKQEYESVDQGVYRHVGAITLTSECLKCHVPHRTSLEDRVAGLSISMTVKEKP